MVDKNPNKCKYLPVFLNRYHIGLKNLVLCFLQDTYTQVRSQVIETKGMKKDDFYLVVQLLSHVQLFTTPWSVARQASPSFTISRSLLKLMSIESVMPSNQLILCCPLLLLPSVFPSIRVFPIESGLHIRWPRF